MYKARCYLLVVTSFSFFELCVFLRDWLRTFNEVLEIISFAGNIFSFLIVPFIFGGINGQLKRMTAHLLR